MNPNTLAVEAALHRKPWLDRQQLRTATSLDDEALTFALVRLSDEGRIIGMDEDKKYQKRRFIWNLTA